MNCRNTNSEELAGVVAIVKGQLARRGWDRPPLQLPRQDRAREPLRALPSHWKPASGNCQGKRNQLPRQTSPSPLLPF